MRSDPREGCRDVWNALMVEGATFCDGDIPLCPTTATSLPCDMITWEEAKAIYRSRLDAGEYDFRHKACVCFFLDDWKFDGRDGIWFEYKEAERILRHFAGVVTPDFSTNQDFPGPWKDFNTYRMRAFGYWLGTLNHQVINCARWGTSETYRTSFSGIPRRTVICIGTVASGLKRVENRAVFEEGLKEMLQVLRPHTVIIYGSDRYAALEPLREAGVRVIQFDSATNRRFKGGDARE